MVVNNININQININVRNYAYVNRAIVVDRSNFYGVNNYRTVRVADIKPTTINDYRAAPVVNNTVINNYTTIKQRRQLHHCNGEREHNAVISRIEQNEAIIHEGRKGEASAPGTSEEHPRGEGEP